MGLVEKFLEEKYKVVRTGGSCGDKLDDNVYDTKEEAQEAGKRWVKSFGKSKAYYKPGYRVQKVKEGKLREWMDIDDMVDGNYSARTVKSYFKQQLFHPETEYPSDMKKAMSYVIQRFNESAKLHESYTPENKGEALYDAVRELTGLLEELSATFKDRNDVGLRAETILTDFDNGEINENMFGNLEKLAQDLNEMGLEDEAETIWDAMAPARQFKEGLKMEKIFAQILRESLKRKDGIYILSGGGLNADYHNIEVWKDGEIVEKTNRQYAVTPEHEDSIFNQAKELADKYNLKIYDGTGAFWSGFSKDWYRRDRKDTSGYVKRGAEWVEYSDQDMKNLDDRPEVTTKWAICTAPGKFDIYDNVQKNPNKFFDTELYRGMAGSHGDRLGDLKKFFNEHADKVYQGTFDDIKNSNYTIAVNGRFYQSDIAKKMIDRILAAGLEFNGKRVTGQVNFGEQKDEWGDYRDEIVEVSCGSWENENEMTRLTQIYDVLTMTGIDVPDEFAFSSEDEPEYMVVVDSNKNLHHTSSSSYRGSKDLKVGDVIELTRTFPYEYSSYRGDSYYSPLFVVIETDGINAKLAPCSDIKTTHQAHSIHDRSEYEVKFNKSKYDSALKGTYKEDETKKLNMLQTRFTKRTKDFIGEQFSESIRAIFAQILKESSKIGE